MKRMSYFPADSVIVTPMGFILASAIREGDYVLSGDNRFHKAIKVDTAVCEIMEAKGHGHPMLKLMPTQEIFATSYTNVWNKDIKATERAFDECSFIPVESMKGKFWASPVVFPIISPNFDLTKDHAWLFGAYFGNGYILRDGKIHIQTNDFRFEELEETLNSLGAKYWSKRVEAFTEYFITNPEISMWMKKNIDVAFGVKDIPISIYGLPIELREAFFKGYIWAKGAFEGERYRVSTGIKAEAIATKLLAQSLGFSVALYVTTTAKRGVRTEKWQVVAELSARSSVIAGENRCGLVREVEKVEGRSLMYGFRLEESESLVVDGIIVRVERGENE